MWLIQTDLFCFAFKIKATLQENNSTPRCLIHYSDAQIATCLRGERAIPLALKSGDFHACVYISVNIMRLERDARPCCGTETLSIQILVFMVEMDLHTCI